ncbi:MAG: TldD/PmbA family protein [Candidatus Heimdallarchaeota archaeon]|nr:TldD/PmbA family protein [Candidatus Heimdallarchaeota archaeon]
MEKDYVFDLLQKAVEKGQKLGGEFIEARYDDLQETTINLTNEMVKQSSSLHRKGIGVMAYYNGTPGYSFTPELSKESIEEATIRAVKLAKSTDNRNTIKLDFDEIPSVKDKIDAKLKKHPRDFEFGEKLELLKRGVGSIKEEIEPTTTTGLYGESYGEKYFVNSEGSEIFWVPIVVDLRMISVIIKDGQQATAFEGTGASKGFEFFEMKGSSPEEVGKLSGKTCKEALDAVAAPAGKTTTLVSPQMGGVVVHESFGHLSESDFVVTGQSPLSDRVGEQLGSDHVSIYDEGITEYGGYYLPYDDQGIKTGKTVLLEDGILKGYLHNRGTAKKMNAEMTGNSRAINFLFNPIVRMKNTYFGKGDLTFEEAVEQVGTGVYAVDMSGGQVGLDGNFMFNCSKGYLIENGEITKPIKNTALSGNILELLKHVQGATKEIKIKTGYFGGCGKNGQNGLAVGYGGPNVIMGQVLVGGAQ